MRRGGELVPELGQAEQAYPWAAMRVFVYAVKHCKVQQGVVKFIGFVLPLLTRRCGLPFNYVQLKLDMNRK